MQVWSKIDFDTGKVIFLDATRKEDMLQVEYPNGFLLDMGSMKRQKQISFPSC